MAVPSLPVPRGLAFFLLLVLGTNWGLGFSLAKFGRIGDIPPLGYVFWQCLGAGIVLLLLSVVRRRPPAISAPHLRYYMLMGAFAIALPAFNLVVVVGNIPVGVMTLIMTLSPLLTYGFAQLAGIDRFEPRRVAGMLLGFAGALLIVLPASSLPSRDMVPWVAMAVITPMLYAVTNVYGAKARPADVDSLALAAAMQFASGIFIAPFTFLTGSFYWPFGLANAADLALVCQIFASCLGSLLFFELIRMEGPVFMSQVAYIVTITGILWGMYFFSEQHSPWIWAALVVILAGVALVTRAPARRPD